MSFKHAVMATPLYPLARAAYRLVNGSEVRAEEKRLRVFYRQFFAPGDVVFDVGALRGEYAEAFAKEGARVVAIEPNPAHRTRLIALSRMHDVTPVFAAISDTGSKATLSICSTPGLSTMLPASSEWIEASPDYAGVEWQETVTVDVHPLSALATAHGKPVFVKIDVEGFEINVLRSMNFTPATLSFEFGARRKPLGHECLQHLGERGYEFRPILGRDLAFVTPDWMTPAQASDWLDRFTVKDAEYGDMFCRRVPAIR